MVGVLLLLAHRFMGVLAVMLLIIRHYVMLVTVQAISYMFKVIDVCANLDIYSTIKLILATQFVVMGFGFRVSNVMTTIVIERMGVMIIAEPNRTSSVRILFSNNLYVV